MRERLVVQYGLVAAGAGAAGIVLITVSELADIDSLRIFGALLITAGGIGTGIWIGLADPRRWPLQSLIKNWRVLIGIGAAVLLSAPVIAALFAALLGLLRSDGRSAGDATVVVGGLIAAALATAAITSVVLGIRVIWRSGTDRSDAPETADGPAT